MKTKTLLLSTLIAAAVAAPYALGAGDGTSGSPLSGEIININFDDYTGTDGTVYVNGINGNSYFANGTLTMSKNLNISGDGLRIGNGFSGSAY
ncbi:MAG: hypothetical protein K6B46_03060, partial [Opitutales bacterium]|nr:hypothetical protein [Opitutales bacterium]